jgi:hypothetical protein
MNDIYILYDTVHGLYVVWFEDKNGRSILAKTKTLKEATKRAIAHRKRSREGKLLKADKSVWL